VERGLAGCPAWVGGAVRRVGGAMARATRARGERRGEGLASPRVPVQVRGREGHWPGRRAKRTAGGGGGRR
jgi:hypothetical protein